MNGNGKHPVVPPRDRSFDKDDDSGDSSASSSKKMVHAVAEPFDDYPGMEELPRQAIPPRTINTDDLVISLRRRNVRIGVI